MPNKGWSRDAGLECCRACRARWSSSATIKKYEAQTGIPNANTRILSAVKSVLESAGIEFTGDPLVNPGVTLRIKRDD